LNEESKNKITIKSALKNYSVKFSKKSNIIKEIKGYIQENPKSILFCDQIIYDKYLHKAEIKKSNLFLVNANENFKTLEGATKVLDFMISSNFTKREDLVVMGGGVIQDVAAFVGATYKRGIRWNYYPTTLLSMCDSCIGAKSSINYKGAKNQLGLFSAPDNIIINLDFLGSLKGDDVSNGLGEIFKLFIIGGKDFVNLYDRCVKEGKVEKFENYQKLIQNALEIKKSVIEVDEFDQNYRKSLNYGHTLGHAIELLSNYKIPHGQAIAIGMIIANDFSKNRGILSSDTNITLKKSIMELLSKRVLNEMKDIQTKDIKGLLLKDKKTVGNNLNFVILKDIGETQLLSIRMTNTVLTELDSIISENFKNIT
jgi:3-dehydroquinate synthase